MMLYLPCSAQDTISDPPDTTGLHEHVQEVAARLQERIASISLLNDVDSIQVMAAGMKDLASETIERVEQAHPQHEALMAEAQLPDASHIDMDPQLALEYQRQAIEAEQKLLAVMPPYYKELLRVRDLSARLSNVRRPEKAQRLNAELQAIEIMDPIGE